MELTSSGFYKTPRIIKGWDFIEHIQFVYNSGNSIYVKFGPNRDMDRVLSYHRVYDLDSDNAVRFQVSEDPRKWVLLEDITEFEFIQYRPQTDWVAINVGKTKRISLEDFDELFISDTFRHLKPVIFLHQEKFWNVMGMELGVDEDAGWWIYLKRQDSDFMTRIRMPLTQKFIYNPLSNSWSFDDHTEEFTDLGQIKHKLRTDVPDEVFVSGSPMKFIRVKEIAQGVLFFLFVDEDEDCRYYYSKQGSTKLRIVTNQETLKTEYRLDHVKAMHID
jgi:hypothetical protein